MKFSERNTDLAAGDRDIQIEEARKVEYALQLEADFEQLADVDADED